MATPAQVAAQLNIPESDVTARGLLDKEFPGVVNCIPEGPSRDAFVNGLGDSLLKAALDDDAGDPWRYRGQVGMIRNVLAQPEMRDQLARCSLSGSAGPSGTPSPSGTPGTDPEPRMFGWGTAAAAGVLVLATGGMLWWATHRTPDEDAKRLPSRSNPSDASTPRMDAATIVGYEWVLGTPYMQSEQILYLQPKDRRAGDRRKWAEVFPDSRTRPTVLVYRENDQGGERLVSEHVTDSGWRNEKLRDFARSLGPRFADLGYAMWFAEGRVAKRFDDPSQLSDGGGRKRRRNGSPESADQFAWHADKQSSFCDVCGATVGKGTQHRALRADELHRHGGKPYLKRAKAKSGGGTTEVAFS